MGRTTGPRSMVMGARLPPAPAARKQEHRARRTLDPGRRLQVPPDVFLGGIPVSYWSALSSPQPDPAKRTTGRPAPASGG